MAKDSPIPSKHRGRYIFIWLTALLTYNIFSRWAQNAGKSSRHIITDAISQATTPLEIALSAIVIWMVMFRVEEHLLPRKTAYGLTGAAALVFVIALIVVASLAQRSIPMRFTSLKSCSLSHSRFTSPPQSHENPSLFLLLTP
jgi:hypothetical protein